MQVLRFLGEVSVGLPPGAAQRQLLRPLSVSILAYLAANDRGGVTRDRLVALLWEDSDRSRARHSLSNQLHILRKGLGSGGILTAGEFVRLNDEVVSADITDFKRAMRDGDLHRAASLYAGPLLDGFHLDGSGAFERWAEQERAFLAAQALEAFEALAASAAAAGEPSEAARWLQRAAQHDPYNSRVALRLARALAGLEDPGNGVQHLKEHVRKLRDDLGIQPDPNVLEFIRSGDRGRAKPEDQTEGPVEQRLPETPRARESPVVPAPDSGGRDSATDGTGRITVHARSRPGQRAAAFLLFAVLAAISVTLVSRAWGGEQYDPELVAILPTLPAGVEPNVPALVSSQLHVELSDWGAMRATQKIGTDARWRRLGGSLEDALPEGIEQRVAAGLGAGRVLTSVVSPAARGIEISATLASVPDGRILAAARASGPLPELDSSVHWLLVQIEAEARGIPEDRIATLARQEPEAVHLFVRAHPRESEGSDQLLREALARDSTFSLAALELYDSYEQSKNDSDPTDPMAAATEAAWQQVAEIIWNNRNRLGPADQAFAQARIGWRFAPAHTARLEVAAWEHAVEVAPDRLSHLQGLFQACYSWCSSFARSWKGPLLDLHDALLERGDTSQLEVGLELAVLEGDSTRVRAYAELLPADDWYGRWLAGVGLNRTSEREAVVARMPELGNFPLMRIGNFAILTGSNLEDAEWEAEQPQRGNPGSVYALRQAVLARERGRHAEYRRLRDKMFQIFHVNPGLDALAAANVIAEWAVFGEPEETGTLDEMDRMLSRIVSRGSAGSPDSLAVAHCFRSYLRLERDDSTGVSEAIRLLETDPTLRESALARMCAPFLDFLVARGEGPAALVEAAGRLHDAVRDRPITFGQRAGLYYTDLYIASAANLELARAFGALGYPETGLQIVERRPIQPSHWGLFGFHVDFVREEARLLAQAGEIEAAAARYAKYFRLRPEPPDLGSWAEEWYVVRAEYEALLEPADG